MITQYDEVAVLLSLGWTIWCEWREQGPLRTDFGQVIEARGHKILVEHRHRQWYDIDDDAFRLVAYPPQSPSSPSDVAIEIQKRSRKSQDERLAVAGGATRDSFRPVMQSRPTNCFQACVASVLGLPIDEVPEACDGAKWDWDAFQDWLATRGMQAIEVGFGNGGTLYPVRKPVLCIVTGKSPRECVTGAHAVVGELVGVEGFRVLHDPHSSQAGFEGEPTHATFFVSI